MLLSRLGSCEAHQHRPRVRDEGGCGGGSSWQLRRETPPFIGEKNRCGLDESNKSTDGAYRPGRRCRGRGLRGCLLMLCHTFLPSAFFITLLAPSSTPLPPSPHSFFFLFLHVTSWNFVALSRWFPLILLHISWVKRSRRFVASE